MKINMLNLIKLVFRARQNTKFITPYYFTIAHCRYGEWSDKANQTNVQQTTNVGA